MVAASQVISHLSCFESHLPTCLDVCCSCVKGPSLYLHYDAADNFVQARIGRRTRTIPVRSLWSCREVLDGMKDFWLYDPFQDYPYFRFAVPRRCRVRAGRWLYVPLYWWHAVRSGPGRTVSLAHFAHSTKKKKGIFEKFLCASAEVNQALEISSFATASFLDTPRK
ncbi:Tyw5 [Symbiodinium sp. CCMP2592]|nr:Tyw5 [Symbiodinium sp. CCMP2592]